MPCRTAEWLLIYKADFPPSRRIALDTDVLVGASLEGRFQPLTGSG